MPGLTVNPVLAISVSLVSITLILYVIVAWRRGWLKFDAPPLTHACIVGSNQRQQFALLVFRVMAALYTFITLIYPGIINNQHSPGVSITYYTIWNYAIITLYFVLSSIQSIKGNGPWTVRNISLSTHQIAIWVLFELEFCNSLVVSLLFWLILAPAAGDELVMNFGIVNAHSTNFGLMFIEAMLNDIPVLEAHFFMPCSLGVLYVYFSWIVAACGGQWDYFFLDSAEAKNAIWFFIVISVHFIMYLSSIGLTKLRIRSKM